MGRWQPPWESLGNGVWLRHQARCPHHQGGRCRCAKSWRGRRWDSAKQKPEWSPVFRTRAEVLTWLGAGAKAADLRAEQHDAGPTTEWLCREWRRLVEAGVIGKRRGTGSYSETTLAGCFRCLEPPKPKPGKELPPGWGEGHYIIEEFGPVPGDELGEIELQMWIDRLAREGLSRSTIANHLAVLRAVFAWAARPTRRLVPRNPTLGLELPPSDEQPRLRVALAKEAADLLEALDPDDRVPYGLAFYAGLRRAEIHRLEWPDVDLDGYRLHVRKAKSEAGTGRRPPIADRLRPILLEAHMRQGRPETGAVSSVSVMSGKLAERATKAWETATGARKADGEPALERITLHECRHTYASFLMASRYTLKELMEYMGHADLKMVQRYVKLLPQPDETNPAERLNAYLEAGGT
jgi:integrase